MTNDNVRRLITLAAVGSSALAVSLALGGCASTIKQDAKSGGDAVAAGAKTIKLSEDGEGESRDIVTYPGGDRVDWKVFEIPKKGDVEVTLKWTSPRPNLDLSMNVLDDGFRVVKRVAPGDGSKQRKTAELPGADPGRYYVQVYASGRGDAGEYTLDVKYTEQRATTVSSANLDPLPNPPRLPGVPGAVAAPGGAGAPGGGTGPKGSDTNPCKPGETCPPGALFINPACPTAPPAMPGTPCPPAPSVRAECPEAGPLPPEKPCPPKPRAAKIIERSLLGQDIIITLDKGMNQGIGKGWTGVVFTGKSGTKPLNGSDFSIFKVTEDESYGKIRKLSMDDLGANFRVELRAPPAQP